MAHHLARPNKTGPGAPRPSRIVYSSPIDAVLLQPWFLPKKIADAIRGMIPESFHRKMRFYFEDYGCMLCGRESLHHSNGMCHPCYQKVLSRMKKSIKRRIREESGQRLDLVLFRQQKLAKKLLKGFAPGNTVPSGRLTLQIYRPVNPVYEAFSAHCEQSDSGERRSMPRSVAHD
jgi:hypothetical protein